MGEQLHQMCIIKSTTGQWSAQKHLHTLLGIPQLETCIDQVCPAFPLPIQFSNRKFQTESVLFAPGSPHEISNTYTGFNLYYKCDLQIVSRISTVGFRNKYSFHAQLKFCPPSSLNPLPFLPESSTFPTQ